jgi:hypothetical protein
MIAAPHTEGNWAMTPQLRYDAFMRAHSVVAENFQEAAERGLARFKALSDSAAAAARERHEALTRFADNLWMSKKLLDDEVAQYCTENLHSFFSAIERVAQAKSASEIVELQNDFARTFTAQVTNQAREIVRLSTRASKQALQAIGARSNSRRAKEDASD